MKILGITGGVGAGKSTVLDFLKEKYHALSLIHIFSAYGMNLAPSGMPFSSTTLGFAIVILISIGASIVAAMFLSKKKYF